MPLGWMVISISCRDRTVINGLLNVLTSYASFEGFIDNVVRAEWRVTPSGKSCDTGVFHEKMTGHLARKRSTSILFPPSTA